MGPVGWQEMVIIFIVALVLFGPRKLPELGRTVGKAITEFRRASNELKSTFEREMQQLERENQDLKEVTRSYVSDIQSSYESGYDSPYQDSGYNYNYGYESHDSSASSNHATTGESAVQDAGTETHGSDGAHQTAPPSGTVARTPGTETASSGHHNPYETPANGNGHSESKPETNQHS
jgi:sec-independent protein translocase protein TatA